MSAPSWILTLALTIKFKLGLFENPYVDEKQVTSLFSNPAKKKLSENIADNSIILLSNKDNILPLRTDTVVALIGPHADSKRYPISGYSYPAYIEMVQSLKSQAKKDISFNGIIDEEHKQKDSQSFNAMYNMFQDNDWKYLNDTENILQDMQALSLKEQLEQFYSVNYAKGCEVSDIGFSNMEECCRKVECLLHEFEHRRARKYKWKKLFNK